MVIKCRLLSCVEIQTLLRISYNYGVCKYCTIACNAQIYKTSQSEV